MFMISLFLFLLLCMHTISFQPKSYFIKINLLRKCLLNTLGNIDQKDKIDDKTINYLIKEENVIKNPHISEILEQNIARNTGLLNLVAILWGSQHFIIKNAVSSYPAPSLVNFSRFLVSLIFFIPSAFNAIKSKNLLTLESGLELGVYSFLGFTFQAIGLQFTTASRSAFLLYLNIKFVPLLAAILYGRSIALNTWISAALALCGTYLLSTDNGSINIGDLWSIAAAVASAMFILRLEAFANYKSNPNSDSDESKTAILYSDNSSSTTSTMSLLSMNTTTGSNKMMTPSIAIDPAELSGISSLVTTLLCLVWVGRDIVAESSMTSVSISYVLNEWIQSVITNPLPPLYLGLVITGLCGYLQVSSFMCLYEIMISLVI